MPLSPIPSTLPTSTYEHLVLEALNEIAASSTINYNPPILDTATFRHLVLDALQYIANNPGGAGSVTSITGGTGLSGGTITTSGTLAVIYGTLVNTACEGNDSRLSNSRTPTAHASTHAAAGSDPVTVTLTSQVTGTLPVANGGTGRTVGNYSIYGLEIHVGKGGNDTTGDGTLINPVLTIAKALTLVGSGRNTVIVHPGAYTENISVTSNNTTIATSELTGANTFLDGTLTLSAAARVSGLKMSNLTITGSGNTYISNCTVDTQVIKSGINYVEIINSELQCTAGVQITGAGAVSIVGNKCWAVAVSNAAANVLIKDCFQVITPSVTAGRLQFDGCAIFAAAPTTNAITSSAGSFITLANSFVLNSVGTSVERVSLLGSYSILNLVYDKANSTLTGTNLNAVDYFSVINAEKIGVNTVADAIVGLKLDSTGVKFNDGTIQTTAAGSGTVTSVTGTLPIASSGGATPAISIANAAADGVTKGAAAFTASDFDATSGVISIDYTNGQAASGSTKGFLTSTDWTTFNSKQATITTGAVDNAILRADGIGGATLQNSGLIIEDTITSFAVTGVASTDIITATSSAFANDQPVRFTALTGGSGLNTTTNYYVINVSGATFQVSTSVGGAASLFTTDITSGTLLNGHSPSPNVSVSQNTTATNSDLVLTPKGTGALVAGPRPNGAASGGDARGTNATDLQTSRSNTNQVASGTQSVICGGNANRSAAQYAAIVGGNTNTITRTHCFIGSGENNSCITFGDKNAIVCGQSNQITAGFGAAIVAGNVNTINGGHSGQFIGAGWNNIVSGNSAVVCGGGFDTPSVGSTASGNYSAILGGSGSVSDRYGMQSHAIGRFAATGDAQRARFVLRCKTTTNTGVEMALDGATTYLGIPSGKVISMTINISGIKSDGTAVAHYVRQYAVKNVSGTSTQVYAPVTIGSDNAAGTVIALSVSDADDTLRILVTGIASETWRWVASVDAVEIAYGT